MADLHDEWSRLVRGVELEPDVLALLDLARRDPRPALHAIEDLDDLVAVIHRHGDTPLLFALRAAHNGSYVAARAIIQAMLPKLCRLTDSVRHGRDFATVVPEAVAAMYEVIYRYPVGRRPRSVAGNLALDTLKALRAALGQEIPTDPLAPSQQPPAGPRFRHTFSAATGCAVSDELAHVLREAQEGHLIGSRDAHLLWLVATGGTTAEVAAQIGMSPTALRKRCSRARASLRAHATQLAS